MLSIELYPELRPLEIQLTRLEAALKVRGEHRYEYRYEWKGERLGCTWGVRGGDMVA